MVFNQKNDGLNTQNIAEMDVYNNLDSEVLSKFVDSQKGKESPFSIHQIVDQGLQSFHKVAGDWYGTNSISMVLRELNEKFRPLEDFEICVFNDGILFKDDVIKLGSEQHPDLESPFGNLEIASDQSDNTTPQDDYFERTRTGNKQSGGSDMDKGFDASDKSKHSGGGSDSKSYRNRLSMGTWSFSNENVFFHQDKRRKWTKSVLIIINVRLGMKKIPEEAYTEVTKMFKIKQNIGILGGKGKFGLYFVGHQKDNLILLDPHYNQETVSSEEEIKMNRDTYR